VRHRPEPGYIGRLRSLQLLYPYLRLVGIWVRRPVRRGYFHRGIMTRKVTMGPSLELQRQDSARNNVRVEAIARNDNDIVGLLL